jgi:hypothetical protein
MTADRVGHRNNVYVIISSRRLELLDFRLDVKTNITSVCLSKILSNSA